MGLFARSRLKGYAAAAVAVSLIASAATLSPSNAALAIEEDSTPKLTTIPVGAGGVEQDPSDFGLATHPLGSAPLSLLSRVGLPDDGELVDMPDPSLRAAVIEQLGTSTITRGKMRTLDSLTAVNKGIADLTGMEYASELDILNVSQNPITTIEPLRGLSKIRQLTLDSTQISDIDPVATMPIINYLVINWTDVSDLEPIRGKTNIWWLQLAGTKVSNIDAVAGMSELYAIYFNKTKVSDVSVLSGMNKLAGIIAPDTDVSDLTPIAGLPNLTLLNLNGARVSDLSMIQTWPSLSSVGFANQRVTGPAAVMSATESSYRTTEAVDSHFKMVDGVVLTASGSATTTPDGFTVWSDIPEIAELLQGAVSGDPYPGSGADYSATLSLPLTRADFINTNVIEFAVGDPARFEFSVTDGFRDGVFSIESGEVPGLALNPTGELTGTPTLEGTYTLAVRCADVFGNMINRNFDVTIAAAAVIPPVTPPVVPPVVPPVAPPVVPPVAPPTTDKHDLDPKSPAAPKPSTSDKLAATGGEPVNSLLLAAMSAITVAGIALFGVARMRRSALRLTGTKTLR